MGKIVKQKMAQNNINKINSNKCSKKKSDSNTADKNIFHWKMAVMLDNHKKIFLNQNRDGWSNAF